MTDWQFLIQKAGDRAWLPLDASSTEILEGRYRIVARSSRSNVPAEIRITHYAIAEVPPKRRVQRRSSRINADGLMMILPFTLLKPGLWEVRCMADVMADFFGESWSQSVWLQVLANSETLDDWDFDTPPGEPEPAVVEIPATTVVNSEPAILLGRRCANAPVPLIPHSPPPPALPDPSPADLPLVAATATEPDPASGVPAPVPELAAIAAPLPDAIALDPQVVPLASPLAQDLAQSLAQDLDQAMQTLLAALATAPLDPTAMASGMASGGAADLGPLTAAAEPDLPPAAAVTEVQERLQAIAQQISEQVVERALQEFDLDAVFAGLQELLETVPATAAAPEAPPRETPDARETSLVAKLIDTPPAAAGDVSDLSNSSDLSDLSDSTAVLPDADLLLLGPLQLSLEQEAYVVRRGQPLRLQGVVSPSDEVREITTTAIGELHLCLRDPQTLKVLASTYQLLPIATLPVDFSCEVNIPPDCATQLLLGEVNLVQLTQPDAPLLTGELPWAERQRLQQEAEATGRVLAQSSAQTAHLLATYAFTIATDVTDLLPHGVLVPDPHVIDPPAPQAERPRIELPIATAIAAPLLLKPSPAAKAPAAEELLVKRPPAANPPESVDLPVFPGNFRPQRSKPIARPAMGLSISFIEISKRSPAAPVPTRPAVLHPLPEQIYHPDPDTLQQLSPKLPAIPSLSAQFAAQSQANLPDNGAGAVTVNTQVELVVTHASVALPAIAKPLDASLPTESATAAAEPIDVEQASVPASNCAASPQENCSDAAGKSPPNTEPGQANHSPSLQALNLGQRFWSRLNAIAADAELADWLREQAEADAESESPAIAAFMTEEPLGETDDSPEETLWERSDNDDGADGWPAQTWPVDNGEEDWPAEDWLETDDAPLVQTPLEPEDWEGEDWIDDDGEAPVAAFDEGVEYAFADTCEDDGGGIDLGDRDTLDDFNEDQAALVETTPEAVIWVEGEAEAGLDAPDTPSPQGRRSVEQLQALTPDPTLTAEMEAFLDALEQGPDWSASELDSPFAPEASSELAVSPVLDASPALAVNPDAETTRTAREIEALLMPDDEAGRETLPNSPSPVLPRIPAPHAEIVIEDEPPSPAAHSPGRILSHPSLFYRLADDEPVPVPLLSLPNQELVAGQSITLCVRLAKTPARIQVKVWVQDRQTRQVLDGPRWLVDFFPCGDAVVEAWTQLTVPLGCLEIQFEAIAIEIYSQRESHKTSLERSVLPPDLAVSAVSRQGYSLA